MASYNDNKKGKQHKNVNDEVKSDITAPSEPVTEKKEE